MLFKPLNIWLQNSIDNLRYIKEIIKLYTKYKTAKFSWR